MLHTFKAVLKGNRLEWIDEVPNLGDRPLKVHVTVLDEDSSLDTKFRGQKMAEVLAKLAEDNAFSEVSDPVAWQRNVRKDRPLPHRNG